MTVWQLRLNQGNQTIDIIVITRKPGGRGSHVGERGRKRGREDDKEVKEEEKEAEEEEED